MTDLEEFQIRYGEFAKRTSLYSGTTYDHDKEALAAIENLLRLGPEIILRYGLAILTDHPDWHLMALLIRLTQAHPVKPEHRGFVRKMADDWQEWGRERGIDFEEKVAVPDPWDDVPVATDDYP